MQYCSIIIIFGIISFEGMILLAISYTCKEYHTATVLAYNIMDISYISCMCTTVADLSVLRGTDNYVPGNGQ